MYFMIIDAKIAANKVQQHIKWMRFIPDNLWFNIRKSITVTHHANRIKDKTYDYLNRWRKTII